MKIQNVYNKILKRVASFKKHPLTENQVFNAFFRYVLFNTIQNISPKARVYNWINNLKFYAQKGDAGIVANIYFKLFDYEDSMFLMHHLKKEDLFIDVGANVGHYSLLAAGVCNAQVMAFEPIPLTFSKLNRNVALNKLSDRIKTYNIGIGNENSFLNFTTNRDVMNRVAHKNETDFLRIQVKKLDDILKDKSPVLMKIDVEGFEYFVLKGATTTLEKESLKYIIIEMNNSTLNFGYTNEEVLEFLFSYGFKPIQYDVKNKKINEVESYNLDKFNTIFIRKNLDVIC